MKRSARQGLFYPLSESGQRKYQGRRKEDQILENVPPEVSAVYLAEDHLRPAEREKDEAEFAAFFGKCLAGQGDR